MTRFPKARPSTGPRKPRARPRTHEPMPSGQYAHDGVQLCAECDNRFDHRVHDVKVPDGAAEVDARKLGEG